MADATAKKILITTSTFDVSGNASLATLSHQGLEIVSNLHGRRLMEDEVAALLTPDVIGMIAGVEPLTRAVLEVASGLQVISRCGTGMDSVDQTAAKELGIEVCNTPNAPAPAVIELTVALMLDVLRRLSESDRALRGGSWAPHQGSLLGTKTVGVIGMGRIGGGVAAIVQAFGAKVLGCDPAVTEPQAGVEMVSFDQLLARADIITLHTPGGPDTRHLINADAIDAMKLGTVLINASRGGLVDEAAVVAGLQSGALGGAAFDTFEQEPYEGPLIAIDRTVLTCHMGARAGETRSRMELEAAENLVDALCRAGLIDDRQ